MTVSMSKAERGSGNQTQVSRPECQAPLSVESSHWHYYILRENSKKWQWNLDFLVV